MTDSFTIADVAPRIQRGELTPSELLEECLGRVDRYEPSVQAWAHLDRDRARHDAATLTAEVKAGRYRGPLHGIPIGVKDIIDVFDMPTGCGSKRWANSYARRDATCVARLRQAGAVIVGKTVTTPFAFFDPPPTRNPWNLGHTPGGSSSGSAAAVACGMVLAALGTQTGGSITRPASYCGVCSLKPTHGRVSVDGVLPFAPSLDHVGVMANSVRDLAMVFQSIAEPDERFGFRRCAVEKPNIVRLGGFFDERIVEPLRPHYEAAVATLAANTRPLPHALPPVGFTELPSAHRIMMAVEAAAYHGERLRRHPEDYPRHIRALIAEGETATAVAYQHARVVRDELHDQIARMLNGPRYFVTPATTDLPPNTTTTGSPAVNAPWSFTGHPTVSLPIGWSPDGLPYAVQLVGRAMLEDELLAVAAWCEQVFARRHRFPPVS